MPSPLSSQGTGRPVPLPEKDPLNEGSSSDDRESELVEFRRVFNENIKNRPVHHDNVDVLLLSWEDSIDDLKVKEEVDELRELFTNLYGFSVTSEKLNYKEKPGDQMQFYLARFKKDHNKPHTLMIIYYAGHGSYEAKGDNRDLFLTAKTSQPTEAEKDRNYIAWSSAESIITGTDADVLVIFDCCEAGGFGGYHVRSPKSTFEFLAACSKGEKTPRPGPASFTSALMWALKRLRKSKKIFSSVNLFDEIKKYPNLPKTQTPELLRRREVADDLVWIEPLNEKPAESESLPGEYRDPTHEYLDLRFDFYRRVGEEDVRNTAKVLSKLINENLYPDFQAKSIVLIDKSSVQWKVVERFKAGLKRKRSSVERVPTIITPVPEQGLSASPLSYEQVNPLERMREAPPPRKRPKLDNQPAPLRGQGALYHFRMFLDCTLQNARIGIGNIADRVRPTAREREDRAEESH